MGKTRPKISNISIIIPNLNDSHLLEKCLIALEGQTFGRENFEIIVVDNGSSDNSLEIARKYCDKVLKTKIFGNPYIARNLGLKNTAHEYIALLDAKCIPEPDSLSLIANQYARMRCSMVVGNIVFEYSNRPTLGEIVDSMVFVRVKEVIKAKSGIPGGSCYFFHISLLSSIGFFREDMRSGADGEWTSRIWKKGFSVKYEKNAKLIYRARSLKELLRKGHRIGKGQLQLARLEQNFKPFGWKLNAIIRMRPPSIKYINYCLLNRMELENLNVSKISLILGIWIYRISYSIGRLGF